MGYPVKRRWDVVWVGYSNYFGIGGEFERPPHAPHEKARTSYRTYLGADWSRRFSARNRALTATLGTFRTITAIVHAGTPLPRGDRGEVLEPDPVGPWYGGTVERVWPVVYWFRNRWDGLRYGLNRDAAR